jgi:iron-sulfur cluster assembly protein|tara:strand:+ start:1566 stop:1904 length:339 start_codon:yes stop_codon:yes gene_type:complete
MMEIITISEKARIQIQKLLEEQKLDKESYFLRVGVKGGGCSGISYEMGFDDIPQEGDNVIEGNSIKIVIDKKSFLYLFGTELDFSDGLNGKGFQFINPNASRTCGCGESFSI